MRWIRNCATWEVPHRRRRAPHRSGLRPAKQIAEVERLFREVEEIARSTKRTDSEALAEIWAKVAEVETTNPEIAGQFTRMMSTPPTSKKSKREIWIAAAGAILATLHAMEGFDTVHDFIVNVNHTFTVISGLAPPLPEKLLDPPPPQFDGSPPTPPVSRAALFRSSTSPLHCGLMKDRDGPTERMRVAQRTDRWSRRPVS